MSSFADHHSAPPLSDFLKGHHRINESVNLLDIDHPSGDFSRPAVAEYALIQLRSPKLSLQTDFGVGRHAFSAFQGEFFLAPPGVPPKILTFDPHRLRCLAIAAGRIRSVLELETPQPAGFDALHRKSFQSPLIAALLDRLWAHAGWAHAWSRLFTESAVTTLAAELLSIGQHRVLVAKGGLAPIQINRIIARLTELDESPSILEIAKAEGVSATHLLRAFRQATGTSPHQFRLRHRLDAAKLLLATGRVPISDIAARLGYTDAAYFARAFRRSTGETPAGYRRARSA